MSAPVPKHVLRRSWDKYGLIVIGNIVFFALLYVFSYRPHNEENRAAEFLSLAQQQEVDGRLEAAAVLYRKITADYGDTRAAKTAKKRLAHVERRRKEMESAQRDEACAELDIPGLLAQGPALYLARYLARHAPRHRALRDRIHTALYQLLGVAVRNDTTDLAQLRRMEEFSAFPALFTPTGRCWMRADWVYDDFFIRNDNFFPWKNAVIRVRIRQGDDTKTTTTRIADLPPGRSAAIGDFVVRKSQGPVTCSVSITMGDLSGKFSHRM